MKKLTDVFRRPAKQEQSVLQSEALHMDLIQFLASFIPANVCSGDLKGSVALYTKMAEEKQMLEIIPLYLQFEQYFEETNSEWA
ncbi:MAG: hypothetical protein KDC12_06015, partial [Flavobacteriales bacterium]|nr:hypothetical protein [Flavobacteriales bacterium]